jgi:hypothetical protein
MCRWRGDACRLTGQLGAEQQLVEEFRPKRGDDLQRTAQRRSKQLREAQPLRDAGLGEQLFDLIDHQEQPAPPGRRCSQQQLVDHSGQPVALKAGPGRQK